MRAIFLIIYLFHLQIASAQNDDEESADTKPSWSDSMPKREDTLDMEFDASMDEDDEDTGLSREDLFGLDDDENIIDNDKLDEEQINKDENSSEADSQAQKLADEEKAAELQRIADEEKAAEILRLADEETAAEILRLADEETAAEIQKIADEEKAAEILKIANETKIAEQNKIDEDNRIAEQQRLTEEKRIADKIQEEQRIVEQEKILEDKNRAVELEQNNDASDTQVEPKEILTDVVSPVQKKVAPSRVSSYKWKKIVNVLPQYPARAIREKKEGWVEVEIELASNGDVVGTKVANSYKNAKTFNRAALKAVKQWKYDPPENYDIQNNQFRIVRILFKL